MSKWTLVVVLVVAAVAGWLVYAQLTEATPVSAARVTKGLIREFVDERAKTRLPRSYLITMPYDGRIEPITLQEGDRVTKSGHPVAQLVLSDIDLKVQAAERAVERLEASVVESEDKSVEITAEEQAGLFVDAMVETVKAAEARRDAGKKKDAFARSQYARMETLFGKNAASTEELERAELAMVESNVDFKQDQFVLNAVKAMHAATVLMPQMVKQYMSRKDLSSAVLEKQKLEAIVSLEQVNRDRRRAELYSPIDGVVLARHISNERHIGAGTELLEIGRLEDLEVEAEVLSQDVVNVKVGNPVELYGPAIGSQGGRGSVTRIFPAGFTKVSSLGVEQQRVKVIVKIDDGDLRRLLEQQGLGVDYRVRVRIFTAEKKDALLVNRSAAFRAEDGKWQVYVVNEGRVQRKTVEVGLENDQVVEITEGLKEGDLVVLAPESSLESGTRVTANIKTGVKNAASKDGDDKDTAGKNADGNRGDGNHGDNAVGQN